MMNVKADLIPSNYTIKNNNISICMDDESYVIKKITGQNGNIYFLNPSHNYNYFFADYHSIAWEDSPFNQKVAEYVAYYHKFNTKSYYYEATVRKLWEVLYPGRSPHFCMTTPSLESAMTESEDVMANIEDGPDFMKSSHYLQENAEAVFTDAYLDNFYISSSDGLDAQIEDNQMIVKAKSPGKYDVILKRRANGFRAAELYTDGTNYLISSGAFPEKEYQATFYVGYKKFLFIPRDASGAVLKKTNFTIYKDNHKYLDITTNNEGIYEGYLPVGEYYLQNESGLFKEYFFIEDDFTLDISIKDNHNSVVSSTGSIMDFIHNTQDLAHNAIYENPEKDEKIEQSKKQDEVNIVFPDTLWLT